MKHWLLFLLVGCSGELEQPLTSLRAGDVPEWVLLSVRDRWEAATGIRVEVSPQGYAPVSYGSDFPGGYVDCRTEGDIADGKPERPCMGVTQMLTWLEQGLFQTQEVRVWEGARGYPCRTENILLHEWIHVMLGRGDHPPEEGIVASWSQNHLSLDCMFLDEKTIEWVCSQATCSRFQPEKTR